MSLPPPPPVPRGRRPLTAAELEASSTDESSSEEKREEREREEKREEQKKREEQRPPPLPPKPAARVHEARQAQAARRSDADKKEDKKEDRREEKREDKREEAVPPLRKPVQSSQTRNSMPPVSPVSPTSPELSSPPGAGGSRRRSAKVKAQDRKQNRASQLFHKLRSKNDDPEELVLSAPTGFARRAHGEAGLACLVDSTDQDKQEQLLEAVALYSFQAKFDGELSLTQGDEIFVTEHQDGDDADWWYGVNMQGRWGYFPANRVQLFEAYQGHNDYEI